MQFRVIEGGLSSRPSESAGEAASGYRLLRPEDVQREAVRRLKATGYETWHNRHLLTGSSIPREVGYLAMQIKYAAEALGRLADIPADFDSDIYWPA